jgi:hypothetical protein
MNDLLGSVYSTNEVMTALVKWDEAALAIVQRMDELREEFDEDPNLSIPARELLMLVRFARAGLLRG